jgi:hypothetical protein
MGFFPFPASNRGMADVSKTSAKPAGSTRTLVALLAFVLGIGTIPHRVCERDAAGYFDGDRAATLALATSVAHWADKDLRPGDFATGSRRFDGEWLFGTYMMAAMGFGQIVLEHPEEREASLSRMERCLDAMLSEDARAFDREGWNGENALSSTRGHVAYLGYAGLALGLHRILRPSSRFAEIDDRFAAALAARIDASPTGFVETYPGEVYPVDNTAALGALALHARATRKAPPAALAKGIDALKARGIDPASGLVIQAVAVGDAQPRDAARASGTALASYFLAYADPGVSRALWDALEKRQLRTVLGFGAILEGSRGDIDSGPVVLGFGVSATGFALGASRMHGDRDVFAALYATAHLFGAPFDENDQRTYAIGGPIGDAILFAMTTAPRIERLGRPASGDLG